MGRTSKKPSKNGYSLSINQEIDEKRPCLGRFFIATGFSITRPHRMYTCQVGTLEPGEGLVVEIVSKTMRRGVYTHTVKGEGEFAHYGSYARSESFTQEVVRPSKP